MATKKPKTAAKKTTAKPKTAAAKKTVKTVKSTAPVEPVAAPVKTEKVDAKSEKIFKGFFAKKYECDDSILTIFKKPNLYGSLLGEVLGTMILTLVLFSLSLMGIASIATYAFAVIAIIVVVYSISGSHLNPLVTAGMMATRRVSVIRGILYIVAQVVGAWFGWMIMNAFHLRGGDSAYALPVMSEIADGNFWISVLIEVLGAIIIGFFFARALVYKRSVFTFAAITTGGICIAVLVGYVISAAFLGLSSNFIFNPAVASMLGITAPGLAVYVAFPMIGGVVGFYLADFMAKLSGEKA